jgi:hypothetical protein
MRGDGCNCFQRGRGGGGEKAPRCRRRMTQQRARAMAREVEGDDW